jgi:hypothetical protein
MYKTIGFIGGALLGLTVSLCPAAAVTMAAHRAVYDLALDRSSNNAGLESADGRMAFEISGSRCEGWTVNFRMVNRFKPAEDRERVIDTRSSSWEAGDSSEMRYTQSEFIDNVLDNETMVSAVKDRAGGKARGTMSKPETRDFEIDARAVFPVEHQTKLMLAAEQGAGRDVSIVFDGSDGEKAYRTISFVGTRHAPGTGPEPFTGRGADVLNALPSWPVSISYYDEQPKPEADGEQTPVYQVSFEMYANGVANRLRLNYGDFTLRGSLASLEFLDQPDCP